MNDFLFKAILTIQLYDIYSVVDSFVSILADTETIHIIESFSSGSQSCTCEFSSDTTDDERSRQSGLLSHTGEAT